MLQHPRVRNLKLRCLFRLLPSALRSAITQLKSGRRHRALKLNSTPLTGGARVLLRASRQNPAEIRKTVHVTQNLRVEIFLGGTECSDMPLRAPACCACKIKRCGRRGGAGDHPVFRIKRFVFLEIENDRCNTVHHRRSRKLKSIFDVTFQIAWRRCQLTHHNDQVFLCGEDFFRNQFIGRTGSGETERGGQLIDTSVSFNPGIGLRKATAINQRSFAPITRSGDNRHKANCRAFL